MTQIRREYNIPNKMSIHPSIKLIKEKVIWEKTNNKRGVVIKKKNDSIFNNKFGKLQF